MHLDPREQIIELIKTAPKRASQTVKRSEELSNWVESNADNKRTYSTFAEKIYVSVFQPKLTCNEKFKSLVDGYVFCGRANKCECARRSVSKKSSAALQSFSASQWKEIAKKRKQTLVTRYGVNNPGKLPSAVAGRKDYYQKLDKTKPKKETLSQLQRSYRKLKEKFSAIGITFVTPETEYVGVSKQTYYEFKCNNCAFDFSTYVDNGHLPVCRRCNPCTPSYVSQAEHDLYRFVLDFASDARQSDKSIINPFELDIVIDSKLLAIEYCGLYWHSSANEKSLDYHFKKMQLTESAGYQLLTVFEDEWLTQPDIVKNRIKHILGKSNKVYARNTVISVISRREANTFLSSTHIQGPRSGTVNLGLFDAGNLVAVMTFGHARYSKDYQYELLRYASKGAVVGGAGKLFSHFVNNYNPESIVSYCDRRWGQGNLYTAIGMSCDRISAGPGYFYTDLISRKHRTSLTKQKLVSMGGDPSLPEEILARQLGWYRIGDCGTNRYVWRKQ